MLMMLENVRKNLRRRDTEDKKKNLNGNSRDEEYNIYNKKKYQI